MNLKKRFSRKIKAATKERDRLVAERSVIDERLEELDCFLSVADSASKGKLLEQKSKNSELDESDCDCSDKAEAILVSQIVDVGVIFDANLRWTKRHICFTCRTGLRIGD